MPWRLLTLLLLAIQDSLFDPPPPESPSPITGRAAPGSLPTRGPGGGGGGEHRAGGRRGDFGHLWALKRGTASQSTASMRSRIVWCLAVLFACAAFAQDPPQEYPAPVEVERMTPAHQQQAADPPAPGESFPEGVSGSEDWSHGRTAETCLAKSLFTDESESGWAVVGRTGQRGKLPGYIELQHTVRHAHADAMINTNTCYSQVIPSNPTARCPLPSNIGIVTSCLLHIRH